MGIMAKAMWEGAVLAESGATVEVEGNQYFPPDAIHKEYFKPSDAHTVCPWKGTASYYDVEVNGKRNAGAAWFYPEPKDAAKQIKGYVAFWKGVKVGEVGCDLVVLSARRHEEIVELRSMDSRGRLSPHEWLSLMSIRTRRGGGTRGRGRGRDRGYSRDC